MRSLCLALTATLIATPALAAEKAKFGGAIVRAGELRSPFRTVPRISVPPRSENPLRYMDRDTRAFFKKRLEADPSLKEKLQPPLWTIARKGSKR